MSESQYKGYWMVTNRCNLRCHYCVLENAHHQLKQELDLEGKKELVTHLYQLGFRRLTLSGGEVTLIGKSPPRDFLELIRHIRTFRSSDPTKNLEIELYTNGAFFDEKVAEAVKGVVDQIAVTIDSNEDNLLSELGRNTRKFPHYYEHILRVCQLISQNGIELKLHSVIGTKTHASLPGQVASILDALEDSGARIGVWKFYQYMSYDVPERDHVHAIPKETYMQFKEKVQKELQGRPLRLHFKDNEEMNDSLFNILSYGNAQYMRKQDSWSTSQRTEDLRTYSSMGDLFAKHDIDESLFRRFHELKR
ncbi:MAG: radical SAM protein [Parachlamydia sp.]|nr:radical SAM protein [Parachlamydia sp.]